jgi:hypothetical protein
MARTLDDLRETMLTASADGPDGAHRAADVRRRIKRGDRLRLTAVAAATTAAVAAGVLALPLIDGDAGKTSPALVLTASDPVPELPAKIWGMPRIGARQFTTTGQRIRVRFTPTGDNTLIVIRCAPGFTMAQWHNGSLSSTGECRPHGDLFGATSLSGPEGGHLTPGRPFTLEVAILHGRPQRELDPLDPPGIERYVRDQRVGKGTWSIGVYSGTCNGRNCH